MKTLSLFSIIAFLLISLSAIQGGSPNSINPQGTTSPTPISTYDPLAEPFLPENPSELELGRHLYWYHCMTCHGEVGQGLTDEFRAIWPEDHQNCWGRGCHRGNRDDEGFPIPTYVPPLVSNVKLAQFSSQQDFFSFLKSTHPPQNPGILEDAEYLAIVRYVFTINERPLGEETQVPTITPIATLSSIPDKVPAAENPPSAAAMIFLGFGIVLLIVIIWRMQLRRSRE